MLYGKPSLGAPHLMTKILLAKNGQTWMSLNLYISVITNIDQKWFVALEHTINHFSFMFVYPNLKTSFLFIFFFSSATNYF